MPAQGGTSERVSQPLGHGERKDAGPRRLARKGQPAAGCEAEVARQAGPGAGSRGAQS